MKVTNEFVKLFEADQELHGTKVALKNVFWNLASNLLKDIGVTRLTTNYAKKK